MSPLKWVIKEHLKDMKALLWKKMGMEEKE
jgi:hypothetical protein